MPSPVPISKDLRSSKFINSFSSSELKLLTRGSYLSAILQYVSQRIINVCSRGRWSNNVHATEHACAGWDLLLRYVMAEPLCSSHRLGKSGFRCPDVFLSWKGQKDSTWYSHVFHCVVLHCIDGQYLVNPSPDSCTSMQRWMRSSDETVQRDDLSGWTKEAKKIERIQVD